MKDHKGIRPQDVVILLGILAIKNATWDTTKGNEVLDKTSNPQNKDLAELLKISAAEVSASLYRSAYAGLITDIAYSKNVFSKSLLEFLIYGLRYVFPVQPGALVRGIATGHSADPLKSQLSFQEDIVWESADGNVRGQAILPLYSTVPEIAGKNKLLYELLALTDSLRIGGARERELAIAELEKRFML